MLELVFFSMALVGIVCWAIMVFDSKTDDHSDKAWFFRPGLGQLAIWIVLQYVWFFVLVLPLLNSALLEKGDEAKYLWTMYLALPLIAICLRALRSATGKIQGHDDVSAAKDADTGDRKNEGHGPDSSGPHPS